MNLFLKHQKGSSPKNDEIPGGDVRVRIAPSPTGSLHIGTARTALYNWLFARKNVGKFVLRIEDTDASRSTKDNENNIKDGLKWLGLDWDEGIDVDGEFGPYRQTERLESYKPYLKKLLENKNAYYCYCTPEELDADRKRMLKAGKAPIYQKRCCNLKPEEIDAHKKNQRTPVIRFQVPENKEIVFEDQVRGKFSFNSKDFGDFVIAKSNGDPLFLLANLIDDYEMKITHVIRGEDHIPNVPKQLLIAEALGIEPPFFAHLSLILNPDRSKMSKRAGPTEIAEYQKLGYLPEALINYIVLLGWNPGTTQEIFTREELVSNFSMKQINKAGAVFDLKRLQWMNGMYLRRLSPEQLVKVSKDFLSPEAKQADAAFSKKVLVTVQERLQFLAEIPDLTHFYFEDKLEYDSELLIWKKGTRESTLKVLETITDFISKNEDKVEVASPDEVEKMLRKFSEDNNMAIGEVFWPLRVALSGLKASPGPQEIIWVLGVNKSLERLKMAVKAIS